MDQPHLSFLHTNYAPSHCFPPSSQHATALGARLNGYFMLHCAVRVPRGIQRNRIMTPLRQRPGSSEICLFQRRELWGGSGGCFLPDSNGPMAELSPVGCLLCCSEPVFKPHISHGCFPCPKPLFLYLPCNVVSWPAYSPSPFLKGEKRRKSEGPWVSLSCRAASAIRI